MDRGKSSSFLNLCHLHVPSSLQLEKESSVPILKVVDYVAEPVWMWWWGETFLLLQGVELRQPSPTIRSQSL